MLIKWKSIICKNLKSDGSCMILHGLCSYCAGSFQECLEFVEEKLDEDEPDIVAEEELNDCENDNYLEWLKKECEKTGLNESEIWELRGLLAEEMGDKKSAIKYFRKAVTNCNDAFVYYSLGRLCAEIGDIDTSSKYFKQGLAYYPNDVYLLFGQAINLSENGMYMEAKRYYKKSITYLGTYDAPEEFKYYLYFNFGLTYYYWKKYKKAAYEFERAISYIGCVRDDLRMDYIIEIMLNMLDCLKYAGKVVEKNFLNIIVKLKNLYPELFIRPPLFLINMR